MRRALGLCAVAVLLLGSPWSGRVGPAEVAALQQRPLTVDTAYACTSCHADKRRAFLLGVHAERNVHCHECHGGDPAVFELPQAHRRPFIGTPTKLETIRICARCHSDPNQMRQYGLPADQLAELRSSRHGQLLLVRGDTAAPTCTDCHDAHTILPPTDARSGVHPLNIPGTCARCHSDSTKMRRYGIGTSQFVEYRQSAHGRGLFERENLAAPTCIGCHGAHSALPAGVTEVANVCGQCHVLVRQALFESPHADAVRLGVIPGCLACHANHATATLATDSVAATCLRCHAPDSPQADRGRQMEEWLLRAERELTESSVALDAMVRAGHNTRDLRFRFRTARTHFLEMQQAQHRLDLDRIESHGLRVTSIARDIADAAHAVEEERWEHRLFLVPVWFLALATIILAGFKLAEVRRGH